MFDGYSNKDKKKYSPGTKILFTLEIDLAPIEA